MTQDSDQRRRDLSRPWVFTDRSESLPNRVYAWLRSRVNRTLFRFIAQRALGGTDLHVLEAGAGSAEAASLFARDPRVTTCVALDIDEAVLRAARARDPALTPVVGDLNHLPFADGAFDLVFNSSTVEHLDPPDRPIREMARVCRPTGRVFVGVPQRLGPLGFQPLLGSTAAGIWIGQVFSRRKLDDLLVRAGLAVSDHLSYFFRFFIGAIASPRK